MGTYRKLGRSIGAVALSTCKNVYIKPFWLKVQANSFLKIPAPHFEQRRELRCLRAGIEKGKEAVARVLQHLFSPAAERSLFGCPQGHC